MPKVPREVGEGPFARRMARDVPENSHVRVMVVGPLAEAPERGGDERRREVRLGRRAGRYLGRGLACDVPGAHHIVEGDDERRLRARFEERLEALDRVVLGEEELDGVRLEQRSAITYERQKVLAHSGGHCGEPVKIPSSRCRDIPRKLKATRRIGWGATRPGRNDDPPDGK